MGGRWASDVVVYGQPIYDLTMPGLPEIPTLLLESPSFQLERLRRLREYWALTALVAGDAASQSTLASILAVDASDMVRLIDSMEKHGWAKRERDPKDRRRQIVAATKRGRKVHEELAELVSYAEDRALDDSTSKQLKHLRKLAASIIAAEEE